MSENMSSEQTPGSLCKMMCNGGGCELGPVSLMVTVDSELGDGTKVKVGGLDNPVCGLSTFVGVNPENVVPWTDILAAYLDSK